MLVGIDWPKHEELEDKVVVVPKADDEKRGEMNQREM